jgi:hypothetical protein
VQTSETATTYLRLRDGDVLEIPPGALTAGSTVRAVYGSPPTGSWAGTAPVGAPVHFAVSPAQPFRKALLLESHLAQGAGLAAAPFGYYRVSTLDTSSHRWVEVPSSYDPQTHMLVTELWHFSWWSKVRQSPKVALIAAECLNSALAPNATQIGRAFVSCLIKQGLTEVNSAIETRILTGLLPKNCWAALQTAGIVAAPGGPPAILTAVLAGIETEPACRGTAGSDGVAAPTVSKVSPSSGPAAGGTKVTVTGWMFATASSVRFGGRAASFTIALNSNSTITATSPLDNPGVIDVHVSDGGGTSPTTSADRFTYTAAPGTGSGTTQPQPTGTGTGSTPQGWTATEALLPFNANAVPDAALYAVSCPDTSTCVAGGEYTDTSGNRQALLTVKSGGTWKAIMAPLPANAAGNPYAAVASVSCPSSTDCMAGGTYTDDSGQAQGLLLRWSDGSWIATEAPLPADATTQATPVTGPNPGPPGGLVVSCPAVSECFAVGSYAVDGYYRGWLLSWSGGSWSAAEAPLPSNAASTPDAMLFTLACPSTSECVAGGDYYHTTTTSPNGDHVLLTWKGGSWTPQEMPLNTSGQLADSALACPTTSACMNVGTGGVVTAGGFPSGQANLLSASNGSWSMTPMATSQNGQELFGVSCLTASDCVAGGYSVAYAGGWSALQAWSGDGWTSIATPVPANAVNPSPGYPAVSVFGVSCPAAGTCVAVGDYNVASSGSQTQALLLAGPD